jgi:hypothetical protein
MTPSDLFSIAMESDTAYRLMQELCKLLDVPYPPDPNDMNKCKRIAKSIVKAITMELH